MANRRLWTVVPLFLLFPVDVLPSISPPTMRDSTALVLGSSTYLTETVRWNASKYFFVVEPAYASSPTDLVFEIIVEGENADDNEACAGINGVFTTIRLWCNEEDAEKCRLPSPEGEVKLERKRRNQTTTDSGWIPLVISNHTYDVSNEDLASNNLLHAATFDGPRATLMTQSRYLPSDATKPPPHQCGCAVRDPFKGRGWTRRAQSRATWMGGVHVLSEAVTCRVHIRARGREACSGHGEWELSAATGTYACACAPRYIGDDYHNASHRGCSRPRHIDDPDTHIVRDPPELKKHDRIGCFTTDVRRTGYPTVDMSEDQQVACTGVQITGRKASDDTSITGAISTVGLSEREVSYLRGSQRSRSRLTKLLYRPEKY